MANQKLPIIDWTSGKTKELPSVEEKKAFEEYCKSKGIEELDIDEFYDTLKDFKNKDNIYEVVNDERIDAIKDNFTPPGVKDEEPDLEVENLKEEYINSKPSREENEPGQSYKRYPTSLKKKADDELDAFTKDLEDYLDKNPDAKKKAYY